jgi:TonB family protein
MPALTTMKTVFIILLSTCCCFAQENYKGRLIKYFNEDWQPATDSNTATYFRTVEQKPDGDYLVRNYYSNSGKLQMEAECHGYNPDLFRHGKTKWFYENGTLQEEADYAKNEKHGSVRTYYKNGKPKGDLAYTEGSMTYKHFYDPFGQDYLVNGTGLFADTLGSGGLIYNDVVNYSQFGSYIIENADTTYLLVEKQAEYTGGHRQLGTDLTARLKYPKSARRAGEAGVVYVAFTVTKQGTVADAEVVKGFHIDCDAEALRVVKTLGLWEPGRHRGKKVNSKFVLPIRFSLAG